VTGTPTPTINWLVNGQPLDRTDQRFYISRDAGTLKISGVKVSDTGRYTCIANNSVGFAERDFNLDVLGTSPSRQHVAAFSVLCGYVTKKFVHPIRIHPFHFLSYYSALQLG